MSTSCKPALEGQLASDIRPFPYPELSPVPSANMYGTGQVCQDTAQIAEARQSAVIEAARKEGEARARAAFDTQLEAIRNSVREALADFARERAAYYQQVEAEVVQLAFSIVRKILRRESQIDPLLLAGLVRVALEKIDSGTRVVVRVNPHQVSECRAYFAQQMDAHEVPEVVEDPNLPKDQCILQTALGTTELGPEIQLKEIEQGLFDLLDRRPRTQI